jgi:hypothetical protein
MLRKAADQAQDPKAPWWQDRREDHPDTKGVLGLYYATPVFRTNINLVMGSDQAQVRSTVINRVRLHHVNLTCCCNSLSTVS